MSGQLPQLRTKTFPLEPYGGEGEFTLRELSGMTKQKITMGVLRKASLDLGRTDFLPNNNPVVKNKNGELSTEAVLLMYSFEIYKAQIHASIIDGPGVVDGKISADTIETFSDKLIEGLMEAILEFDGFPLEQKDGRAQKKEQ